MLKKFALYLETFYLTLENISYILHWESFSAIISIGYRHDTKKYLHGFGENAASRLCLKSLCAKMSVL